jgi:hypothetical protein
LIIRDKRHRFLLSRLVNFVSNHLAMKTTIGQNASRLSRFLYWTPRILSIGAILFISIFALDAFAPGLTLWQQLGAFFMHMIPSIGLAILLGYAWKHERWGGILFMLIGLIFTPIIFNWNYRMNDSVWISLSIIGLITLPFVVVGILFLVHDYLTKRTHSGT